MDMLSTRRSECHAPHTLLAIAGINPHVLLTLVAVVQVAALLILVVVAQLTALTPEGSPFFHV